MENITILSLEEKVLLLSEKYEGNSSRITFYFRNIFSFPHNYNIYVEYPF